MYILYRVTCLQAVYGISFKIDQKKSNNDLVVFVIFENTQLLMMGLDLDGDCWLSTSIVPNRSLWIPEHKHQSWPYGNQLNYTLQSLLSGC